MWVSVPFFNTVIAIYSNSDVMCYVTKYSKNVISLHYAVWLERACIRS